MTDPTTWRTGRKVGRTIYAQLGPEPSDDDPLIGAMDTPELAAQAVGAVRERDRESGIARSLKAHLVSEQERLRGHITNIRTERDQACRDRDLLEIQVDDLLVELVELRRQRESVIELCRLAVPGRPTIAPSVPADEVLVLLDAEVPDE